MKNKKLLATDLDGTLIGKDKSMYRLIEILNKNNILLCFITGRDLKSVKDFLKNKKIKTPDFLISMVGTKIYLLRKNKLVSDKNWTKFISKNWKRKKIIKLLQGIKELKLQPKRWQTALKLSYFLEKKQEQVLKEIKKRIKKAEIKAKIIYSCDKFLDFLPEKSSKAGALKYLIKKINIKNKNVIVAGDSGNDLELFKAGFRGIIVANAQKELKNYKQKNAYHAKKKYSAGIIEGLKHFDFIQ